MKLNYIHTSIKMRNDIYEKGNIILTMLLEQQQI